MTVKELKEMLETTIASLDELDENDEVRIYSNTYWIKSSFFLSTPRGFIDLRNPTDIDDDEDY